MFKGESGGLVPIIFEISIDCDYNLVRLNRPEYTPYYQQGLQILLQDGLCLLVQNVESAQVTVGGQERTVDKVFLKNIAGFD